MLNSFSFIQKNTKGSHILILLILFYIGVAVSCSPEKKLARNFLSSRDTTFMLLLVPDDLVFMKCNLSFADEKSGADGCDEESQKASIFLNVLENKKITDLFYVNMESVLKSGPFKVYNDDEMNQFLQLGKKSYIIRLAQLEIDELLTPYTASEQFDSLNYYEEFELNNICVNLWLEVREVNGTQDTSQVLFSKLQIADAIDGYFSKNSSGMVVYNYERNDIKTDDIYSMVSDFGEMNAHYLHDYFMNKYIHEKYTGSKSLKYYHYDGSVGKIFPAGYNRFVFM